ncbi:helix-turn-helix domain-containing protein [Anaerocolumna chitinilytica]|uniref:HTH cro/C1-type domain-containing protein n=1 Tax=Anaerocolumna chitinilytica TaxID=1727145 RepID=A0A7I8DJ33_9FIRM|nr:helix-turn-helix domain-containing protein [Anaerocolumna chitinilytica]BCJ98463.1 hypothetical protein bsdcttw_15040 [Anaerocolumna chitinilytica]
MVRLGHYLRELRENLGLMQKTVANKLGISNKVLSNYEKDVRIPDLQTFASICKFYNVSADTLLNLDINSKNNIEILSEEDKKVLTYYKRLADENKEFIIGQMIGLYKEQRNNTTYQKPNPIDSLINSSNIEIREELENYKNQLINEDKHNTQQSVNKKKA